MPPPGWATFGTHADEEPCDYTGALSFSDEVGEDGLPEWERHDDCKAATEGEKP